MSRASFSTDEGNTWTTIGPPNPYRTPDGVQEPWTAEELEQLKGHPQFKEVVAEQRANWDHYLDSLENDEDRASAERRAEWDAMVLRTKRKRAEKRAKMSYYDSAIDWFKC